MAAVDGGLHLVRVDDVGRDEDCAAPSSSPPSPLDDGRSRMTPWHLRCQLAHGRQAKSRRAAGDDGTFPEMSMMSSPEAAV